jgi:hypothetical protein
MAKILNVTTLKPAFKYSTPEVVAQADKAWLKNIDHSVRRVKKKVKVNLTLKTQDGGHYLVEGESEMSLQDLEIPDPSILVATVHDKVRVKFKATIEAN